MRHPVPWGLPGYQLELNYFVGVKVYYHIIPSGAPRSWVKLWWNGHKGVEVHIWPSGLPTIYIWEKWVPSHPDKNQLNICYYLTLSFKTNVKLNIVTLNICLLNKNNFQQAVISTFLFWRTVLRTKLSWNKCLLKYRLSELWLNWTIQCNYLGTVFSVRSDFSSISICATWKVHNWTEPEQPKKYFIATHSSKHSKYLIGMSFI